MVWISDFFKKNPNLKKKRFFFCFGFGGGGGGWVSDFFTKNRNLHIFFLGGEGVNWKG